MPSKKVVSETSKPRRRRRGPPISPESRENQVIALAYDLAEEQIRNGTASAQVITHFLKMGSKKERLEKDILEKQGKLLSAKTDQIESIKRTEEIYKEALDAMRMYRGEGKQDDPDLQ